MSKIDKLIRELCPEGVEFVELGSACLVKAGQNISKELISQSPGAFPVINSGRDPLGFYSSHNVIDDPIGVASRGSVGLVTWTPGRYFRGNLNYGCTVKNPEVLLPRFLFHFLLESDTEIQALSTLQGIPALNAGALKTLKIPMPPLELQREVVSILDKFTELEAELEAELDARSMQREETRKSLVITEGSRVVPLSKIAAYSQLRVASHELTSSNFVGVDNLKANKGGVKDSEFVPSSGSVTRFSEGDVLLGNIRPYLRKIWSADRPGGCSGDVLCIRLLPEAKDQVNPRYLYHCLASEEFFEYAVQTSKGAKMPRGDKASILKYPVHVPSLSQQSEIVSILDKLDALVHDVTMGIPAEISARREQYEYYRNKLLTFKELEAA